MKTCISCLKAHPITEYYSHAAMLDGHLGKCKTCCRRDAISVRMAGLDKYRAYDRQRANQPKRVEARKRYRKTKAGQVAAQKAKDAWSLRNKHKKKAAEAINNALRDGRISKTENCQRCGLPGILQGHHPDYSKPLEVLWFHDHCHKAIHKEERAARRKAARP